MKVKMFSHNDLDGVGCPIVAKQAFTDLDYDLCNYNDIDAKVNAFLDTDISMYNLVLITDISVNEETAKRIDALDNEKVRFELIDHHATVKWLNAYKWAHVQDVFPWLAGEQKSCGTNMLYTFLMYEGLLKSTPEIISFVELVRSYDTWEWQTKYNDVHPRQLNDLLYIIGHSKFINRFSKTISPIFTTEEASRIQEEETVIQKYIDKKAKELITLNIKEHSVGIVFAESYQSLLGNKLAEMNPEVDFIVMIDAGSGMISYRSVKDTVDLGEFAKQFGGGGHPKAAGSKFNTNLLQDLVKKIFK